MPGKKPDSTTENKYDRDEIGIWTDKEVGIVIQIILSLNKEQKSTLCTVKNSQCLFLSQLFPVNRSHSVKSWFC